MSSAAKGGSSSSFHFVAGLGSGILSAVILQPADLLKTRVQQSGSSSLIVTIRTIAAGPDAIRAFWRGTLPSTLRTGFGSALYFTGLNVLRENVARSNLLRPLVVAGQPSGSGAPTASVLTPPSKSTPVVALQTSSALPKLSNLANLTTGAVARAAAGFILMPMTIIKVRYESNLYSYTSIAGACKDILRKEGIHGFFSGFGATAMRDAPYAGLYVVFYEQSKKRLSHWQTSTITEQSSAKSTDGAMKTSTSASINFTSGALAAGVATALTNPFDAIKTRVQLQPKEYLNLWHAGTRMVKTEGIRSLFDGLGLRMGRKALSSALAWTLYEELVRKGESAFIQRKNEVGL